MWAYEYELEQLQVMRRREFEAAVNYEYPPAFNV